MESFYRFADWPFRNAVDIRLRWERNQSEMVFSLIGYANLWRVDISINIKVVAVRNWFPKGFRVVYDVLNLNFSNRCKTSKVLPLLLCGFQANIKGLGTMTVGEPQSGGFGCKSKVRKENHPNRHQTAFGFLPRKGKCSTSLSVNNASYVVRSSRTDDRYLLTFRPQTDGWST